ncbi:MAG: hypothetical protein ACK5MW_09020 [Enterococcus sp.]
MGEKRKKRLMEIDNRIVLPLSEEFLKENNLQANDIVGIDETLLAQAVQKLTQQDILDDVLAKVMGQLDETLDSDVTK